MTDVIELRYALDTFYLLISGALVMWMAAGFTMLEAGLVRSRNTVEILTKNFTLYAIACIAYLISGYAIMYGESASSWLPAMPSLFGGEDNALTALAGEDAPAYSNYADFFFQVVFVATAMSIVSGTVAERMKLSSFLLFCIPMTALIYPVLGFWKWGGGFLDTWGFKDFAGSGLVHLCGAVAALVGAALLGPRLGRYSRSGQVQAIPGANLPLAAIGTLILWFGWFGFNGGSQLKISTLADANAVAKIFVNTNTAACAGALAALLVSRIRFGKADLTLILNGALGGLVAITAEPLTPAPILAVLIGLAAGCTVVFAIPLLDKLRIDDPVGAVPVHGFCGVLGLLVVPMSNPDASYGVQALGAGIIVAWVGATSLIVWIALKLTLGLRLDRDSERIGADLVECGLEAYPEFVSEQGNSDEPETTRRPTTVRESQPDEGALAWRTP